MNQIAKEVLQAVLRASVSAALDELRAHKDDPCIKQHTCLLALLGILKPAVPVIKTSFPKELPLIEWAEKETQTNNDAS